MAWAMGQVGLSTLTNGQVITVTSVSTAPVVVVSQTNSIGSIETQVITLSGNRVLAVETEVISNALTTETITTLSQSPLPLSCVPANAEK